MAARASSERSNRRAIETDAIGPLASCGPLAQTVDRVIARRFEARGRSWFRHGVLHRA